MTEFRILNRISPISRTGTKLLIFPVLTGVGIGVVLIIAALVLAPNEMFLTAFCLSMTLAIIITVGIAVRYIRINRTKTWFRGPTTVTTALILDRRTEMVFKEEWSREKVPVYHVVVQFDTPEDRLSLDTVVNEELYLKLEPGQKTKIKYSVANPRIALLEGEYLA